MSTANRHYETSRRSVHLTCADLCSSLGSFGSGRLLLLTLVLGHPDRIGFATSYSLKFFRR